MERSILKEEWSLSKEMKCTPTEYKGYAAEEFTLNGHACIIIKPTTAEAQRRWVWRAEFLGAFDTVDMRLLEMGWHIAYCKVSDMFGCPESIAIMKEFHDYVTAHFQLCRQADIFGFSRGGLYATHYTLQHPEDIAVLYLDAPVLSLFSWPMGRGAGEGSARDAALCAACWHIDPAHPEQFHDNPLDHLDSLLATEVPILLIAGDSDTVVPYAENGRRLADKMLAARYDCRVIVKPGVGHHPHSLEDPTPAVDFIAGHFPR